MKSAYVLELGVAGYREAWDLQRALSAGVGDGRLPDTVILVEHPPVVTLGRRTEADELHIPTETEVEVVETDRGGKSTYHGPGQLVCYPIFDLTHHGQDVKKYCRDLEEALIRTMAPFGLEARRIEGLTGIWLEHATRPRMTAGGSDCSTEADDARARKRPSGPRKIASIGIHISKWVTTHGYALNVDLDPAPFTEWITACGIEDAQFTTMARELERPVAVTEVRPHALAALAEVFDLEFDELPADALDALGQGSAHERPAQPAAVSK